MATQLQLRRGTALQVAAFTGAVAEVTVDTTNNRLVVHDGVTSGGKPQASEAYVQAQLAQLASGNSQNLFLHSTTIYP
jgi:hypothetical protein